jgi:hypothetical protein
MEQSQLTSPSSSSVDALTAEEALGGLYEAYWRMQQAIAKRVREETEGLPEFLRESAATDVRASCFPEEKRLWEDAYRRVMSALIRHGLEHGALGQASPEPHQTHGAARETVSTPEEVLLPSYDQISMFER